MKFLTKIITYFKGLFNSIQRKWNSLIPSVQEAFKLSSAIVDELENITNSEQAKVLVSLLIPKLGPVIFATLEKLLPTIVTTLGVGKTISVDNTVEENILLLAQYLKDKKGIDWASNADQLYKLLTLALADDKLTFSEIQLIGKWVYDNVIVIEK